MTPMVLLLTLSACSFVDQVGSFFGAGDVRAPGAPTTPVVVESVASAQKLLGQGKGAEALAMAEKLLAKSPNDDAVWDLVELCAIRSGSAEAMLDRLAPDKSIGGRDDRHQALRASLAIHAKRLPDALVAIRALETLAPGDAAALAVAAVAAGLSAPEDLNGTTLRLIARSKGAEPGAEDEAVAALAGWRVALVRGEIALRAGNVDVARAEAAKAKGAGVLADVGAAVLEVGAAGDADAALSAAEAATKDVVGKGDAVGAGQILGAAGPRAYAGWKAVALVDLAERLRKSAGEGGSGEGAAAFAAVQAEAALHAGQLVRAREAATVAAASTTSRVRGGWMLGLTSAALGDAPAVIAATKDLGEPWASAGADLAAALDGADPTLPSAALSGDDAAMQALFAAGWLDNGADALARARSSAVSSDLKLWADAWTSRSSLAVSDTPAQKLESAARSALNGGGGNFEGDHPNTNAWAAVFGGGGAPEGGALAPWARLRGAEGEMAAKELGDLAKGAPAWRTGAWSPVLVLDGPRPSEMANEVRRLAGGADPIASAVVAHGWAHDVARYELGWHHGVTPFHPASSAQQRAAVWDASAKLRYGELAWLAGAGAWPTEAEAALVAAEKAAGLVPEAPPSATELRTNLDKSGIMSFARFGGETHLLYLTASGGSTRVVPGELAGEVGGYMDALASGQPAVATGDRLRKTLLDAAGETLAGVGRILVVGDAPLGLLPITSMPEQADGVRFLAEIRNVSWMPDFGTVSGRKRAKPEPEAVSVAEAAKAETAKKPKKPAPKPAEAKPEGKAGKADDAGKAEAKAGKADAKAGKAGKASKAEEAEEEEVVVEEEEKAPSAPVGLAIAANADEVELLRRVFPGGITILEASRAKVATVRKHIATVRFLHIGDLETAAGGGWKLSDGELPLSILQTQGLSVEGAYLGGRATPEVIAARIAAARNAEIDSTMVGAGWSNRSFHLRMMQRWWEGMNRSYSGPRALLESRQATVKELGEESRVPQNWAGYYLASRP